MIVYPVDWEKVGKKVALLDIDGAMLQIIDGIACDNLSYSGGLDSSLLLYYLLETKGKAHLYTMVNSENHPDLEYATLGREYFEARFHKALTHTIYIIPDYEGNDLVKKYYEKLELDCSDIITGDGIDEFACGYYEHQKNPDDATFHRLISQLQTNHIQPLHNNSGGVRVYIPYINNRIVDMMCRIPLADKVNSRGRKLTIKALADGRVPDGIIERRKYGLATSFKGANHANP